MGTESNASGSNISKSRRFSDESTIPILTTGVIMNHCMFCGHLCEDKYRIVEVKKNKAIAESYLCELCGPAYVEGIFSPKTAKQDPPVAKQNVQGQVVSTAAELLAYLLGQSAKKPKPVAPKQKVYPPCPKCGHTLTELQNTGQFGCGYCYTHFDNTIVPVVEIAQRGAKKHVGKVPKNFVNKDNDKDNAERLKILRLRMAHAVEHENYEEAAKIKEQIKELES